MLEGVLLILVIMFASFVQRVSGFGFGIVAMLFLPHFMPTHTMATAIASLCSCVTSTYNAVYYRKNIKFKSALPMICAAFIAVPISVKFAAVVSADIFKMLLGIVLIILSIYFLLFNKKIRIKANFTNGIIAGALGGTLDGLFSTGGPPAVLYLNNAITDNITYFATIQFYFCFNNLYSTSMRAVNGIITKEVLLFAAIGMIGCIIGNFIGKKVFDKLDAVKLKYIIYVGMIVSGIVMFF